MTKDKAKILIDIDGVCLDWEGEFRRVYNKLLRTYAPELPELEGRLKSYGIFEMEELDKFWLQETLKEMCTFDMRVNSNLVNFIDKLEKEGVYYRIVTARTYNHSETIVMFDKVFGVPREKIWFIPEKEVVLKHFTHVIEDNPNVTGKNVYIVAHKYNEMVKDVKMRDTSKNITLKILKELKIK